MFLQSKIAHLNKMQYKNYICFPGGVSLPKAEPENKPSAGSPGVCIARS